MATNSKIYKYTGLDSGGSSCHPGPNTVGTEELIDGSVKLEDLNVEVKDQMADRVSSEEVNHFEV